MVVYRIMKGCNGCKIVSGRQKDHNHFIVSSEEYEKFMTIFLPVAIFIISMILIYLVFQ